LYIALDQGFIGKEDFNKACEKAKQVSGLLYKFIQGFKTEGYSGLRHKRTPEEIAKLSRW
jgi:predicted RNA-binding protein associated with RNAse of E/G family